MARAFKVNRECEEQKIARVDLMTPVTKEKFFKSLPRIDVYFKAAAKEQQINRQLVDYRMDKCKVCVQSVGKPSLFGEVNF